MSALTTSRLLSDHSDALELSGVTKRFGGLVAISDVSFSMSVGRIHGLIGPNGAGKSTTVGAISGFIKPDSGRIGYAGRELIKLDPASITRLGVARTFQQATPLAGLTVRENILIGLHTRYRSGLTSVLLRLPNMRREARAMNEVAEKLLADFDLLDEIDMQAKSLTFGKLRFLQIARAVATRPRLLLLDEPAAGLNKDETERLATLIRDIRDQGVGMLLIDHDVPFVFDLCDEVTVMNFGSVIASGAPNDVYRNPAVREAYLGNQDDDGS